MSLAKTLPRWVTEPEAEDASRFVAMSPAERIELCLQLCDVTDSIVNARPDVEALRAPTPLSTESEALWRRLIAKARGELA
jgi:hypothetical protein